MRKPAIVLAAVALAATGSVPTTAEPGVGPLQQACATPDRSETLYANHRGKYKIGYARNPNGGRVPGPLIEMTEGECIEVTLVNNTDRKISLHPHGVDYTVTSDGSPLNDGCVRPGESRSYVWSTHGPQTRTDGTFDPGSAGYWWYHDHCLGGAHGTGGLDRGLFGALVVRRPGDPVPDRQRTLVMADVTFNLRRAPDTPTIRANLGERVEFIVITTGQMFHTFHLHGHRWVDNRTGVLSGPDDQAQIIDNKTQGPGDSFGFQVIAGEHVGAGAWMYHCHVQNHADLGMSGIFLVADAGGQMTPAARRALRAWRNSAHR